jgi:hypothetical protein
LAAGIEGFEGTITGYAAPDDFELITAPDAGKKKVIVSFSLATEETAANQNLRLYKLKAAVEIDLAQVQVKKNEAFYWAGAGLRVTLDHTDESLRLEIIDGTGDVHYDGSLINID